ncbi:MAG: YihY/virulence factor BrkB family protein [Gammaproteobacteria bacterium]
MESYWEALKVMAWNSVWAVSLANMSPVRAWTVRSLRFVHTLFREFSSSELNLRAAGLVYTTLLSMVPALAVTFAILKAFNVHSRLEPTLQELLLPFGTQAQSVASEIVRFVELVDLAKLGSMGLAVLLFTIVMLMLKIEYALNYIYRVERPRALFDRLSGYLTVVLLGPLLCFTALGVTASLLTSPTVVSVFETSLFGTVVSVLGRLVPYLLVTAAFVFIYMYIPNTRVKTRSALFGAVVAGVLWASLGWLFATLAVTSSRYTVLYSGFAILILFMMWMFLSWLIVLVGGSVAFYHQNPEYLGLTGRHVQISNRLRERLGLDACVLIAQHFHRGLDPPTAAALARRMQMPLTPLEDLLRCLTERGILRMTATDPARFLPSRALDAVPLAELWTEIRSAYERRGLENDDPALDDAVCELLERMDRAGARLLDGKTWRDLVVQASDTVPPHGAMDDETQATQTFVDVTPLRRERAG